MQCVIKSLITKQSEQMIIWMLASDGTAAMLTIIVYRCSAQRLFWVLVGLRRNTRSSGRQIQNDFPWFSVIYCPAHLCLLPERICMQFTCTHRPSIVSSCYTDHRNYYCIRRCRYSSSQTSISNPDFYLKTLIMHECIFEYDTVGTNANRFHNMSHF